jgi:hypothetical protein
MKWPKKSEKTKRYPPIPSFQTVTGFIETLNSTTVPPVIDSSLLPKMSGTNRSWLMSGMRYLGLIDASGVVQKKLRNLVTAWGTPKWKDSLQEELLPAYQEVTNDLDLDSGTQAQLYEAFRTRGNVDGQMLEKAVRFYLALLTECGLAYSPHFKSRTIRKPGTKKRTKKKNSRQQHRNGDDDDPDDPLGDFDEEIWARFQIPIPGKGDAIIALPREIDANDWQMVSMMLDAYIQRLTKE